MISIKHFLVFLLYVMLHACNNPLMFVKIKIKKNVKTYGPSSTESLEYCFRNKTCNKIFEEKKSENKNKVYEMNSK